MSQQILNLQNSSKKSEHYRQLIKKGGGYICQTWIQHLILEIMINGILSSTIRPNIISQVSLIPPDIVINNLPSEMYIRQYRTVIRIIGETLTAYRGARASMWQHLFTDGTSRRQIAFQNLIISITENDDLRPLTLSSTIILEGGSSEQQQSDILDMITRGGQRLQR